jgi:hypothetical protein
MTHAELAQPGRADIPLGHCLYDDPEPRIVIDPGRPYAVPVNGVVDVTGCGCNTRAVLRRNALGLLTHLVVEHEPRCPYLARLYAAHPDLTF